MRNIKMIIQYDGTRYKGWQRQEDEDKTIQGKIEEVLRRMTGEKIEVTGAGRTDAGVHAENQAANFKTSSMYTIDEILNYCYSYLPEDIVIKSLEETDLRFHSRYNAKGKEYVYKIDNSKYHNVFKRKYSWHIKDGLNIDSMRKASEIFVGEHDFTSFTTMKSKKKSAVREIYSIKIIKNAGNIDIVFNGNGFLYNMVRIIVGTLIEVGLNRMSIEDVAGIMDRKDRSIAGPTAPAQGLFLMNVFY